MTVSTESGTGRGPKPESEQSRLQALSVCPSERVSKNSSAKGEARRYLLNVCLQVPFPGVFQRETKRGSPPMLEPFLHELSTILPPLQAVVDIAIEYGPRPQTCCLSLRVGSKPALSVPKVYLFAANMFCDTKVGHPHNQIPSKSFLAQAAMSPSHPQPLPNPSEAPAEAMTEYGPWAKAASGMGPNTAPAR